MRTSSKVKVQSPKSKVQSLKFGFAHLTFLMLFILANSCHSGTQKTAPTANTNESGVAKFVISEEIHNFGSLNAGEVVSFTFIFKNEGTRNLVITDIDSGCGCTKVNIPNKTIEPGQEGQLEVIYDSAGEVGKQLKVITVFSNAEPKQKQLYIKANITNEVIEINS